MRIPLLLHLLLFTSVLLARVAHRARVVPKCDESLLDGPNDTTGQDLYTFPITKELQCTDGKEIEFAGSRYAKLECDVVKGWRIPGNTNKVVFRDPAMKFTFKCEAKILKCDSPLIDGPKDIATGLNLFTYFSDTKELQCNDGKEIVQGGNRYAKLSCDVDEGWVNPANNDKVVFNDLSKKLKFTCEMRILKCDNPLIEGPKDISKDLFAFSSNELQCIDGKEIEWNGNRYAKLKCDEDKGWVDPAKNDRAVFGDLSMKFAFNCKEKLKCDESLILGPFDAANNAKFDFSSSKELTCKDVNEEILLTLNSKRYSKLVCDKENGWKNPTNTREVVITDPSLELNFDCVLKPCNGKLILSLVPNKPSEITAQTRSGKWERMCKDTTKLLEYRASPKNKFTDVIKCKRNGKWDPVGVPSTEKIYVGCVPKQCHQHHIDMQSSDVQYSSTKTTATLKCATKGLSLRFGQTFAGSVLTCDKRGDTTEWVSSDREIGKTVKIVRNLDEPYEVDCAAKKCHPILVTRKSDEVTRTSNTISCLSSDKELKINEPLRYLTRLDCNEDKGWTDELGNKVFTDPEAEFEVECVEKSCDKSLITFINEAEISFEKSVGVQTSAKMFCKDNTKALSIDDDLHDLLTCKRGGKWTNLQQKSLPKQKFSVNCIAKACHKSLIKHHRKTRQFLLENNKLSCRANTNEPKDMCLTGADGVIYYSSEFVCDPVLGWFRGTVPINTPAVSPIEPECFAISCDKSLLISSDVDQIEFYGMSRTGEEYYFLCNGGKYIEYNRKIYTAIRCNKNRYWVTLQNTELALANTPISLQCVLQGCHNSLMILGRGVKLIENTNNKVLSCADTTQEVHVVGSSVYSASLTCEVTSGWSDGGSNPIKAATDEISVQCVAGECDDSNLMSNEKVKILDPDSQYLHRHAKCLKPSEKLYVLDEFHDSLECDKEHGWKSYSKDRGVRYLGIGSREKIDIDCRIDDRCDHKFIKGDKNEYHFDFAPGDQTRNEKILKCRNSELTLKVNGVYYFAPIICNMAKKLWTPVGYVGNELLKVDCVKLCAFVDTTARKYIKVDEEGLVYCESTIDSDDFQIPRLISVNNQLHTVLHCTPTFGWLNERRIAIASAETKLELQCLKYCMFNYVNKAEYEKYDAMEAEIFNNLVISSPNKLYVFQALNAVVEMKPADELTCSLHEGWRANGVQIFPDTSYSNPLKVKSMRVCTFSQSRRNLDFDEETRTLECTGEMTLRVNGLPSPILKCDPTPGWHDPQFPSDTKFHHDRFQELQADCIRQENACYNYRTTDEESELPSEVEPPLGEQSGTYSCRNKKLSENNNAIKLNGLFVHSQLHCDFGRGWTDFEGKWLAASSESVVLTCENIKCKATVLNECPNQAVAPVGYECASHDFDSDPDPNVRLCGKRQSLLIAPNKLAFGGIRCSDDGSWHEIGDRTKRVVGTPEISCVQKYCNKCKAPRPPDANRIISYKSVPNDYTKGSYDSCAILRCETGLWLVEIDGIIEEYAGDIVCSTKKDEYWILDEPDIVERRQIETVECIEEIKMCKPGVLQRQYENFNKCVVTEDGNLCECSENGDKLFYKKKDAPTFEKIIQIQCNRKSGWVAISQKNGIVQGHEVHKTDFVICANNIPEPNTPTSLTTVIPKMTACDVCPHPFKTWLQCDDCSHKVLDIQLANSHDNEKCIAKSSIGGKFHSELQGEINDPIECAIAEKVWKYNGKEIGKVAAFQEAKKEEKDSHTVTIIASCSLAAVVLAILLFLAYKVFISKRNPGENSGSKKDKSDDKKKNENNDLEDVKVDNM